DVVAGAGGVVSGEGQARRRRADLRAERRGEVDAGMDVVRRTCPVERLQLERGAAEGLGHDRADHDGHHRQADGAGHLCRPDEKDRGGRAQQCDEAHHAFTSACAMCVKAEWTVDCTLCAAFSLPPSAPGILNTIRRDASAKRWWTGLMPSRSRPRPIASTNSCAGCMKRLVVKCDVHILARWLVSGSMNSTAASGAVIASTIR